MVWEYQSQFLSFGSAEESIMRLDSPNIALRLAQRAGGGQRRDPSARKNALPSPIKRREGVVICRSYSPGFTLMATFPIGWIFRNFSKHIFAPKSI